MLKLSESWTASVERRVVRRRLRRSDNGLWVRSIQRKGGHTLEETGRLPFVLQRQLCLLISSPLDFSCR